MLYSTLILPYLTYCVNIWGNTLKTNLNKLAILQKRAIRIMAGLKRNEHTTSTFLKYNCLKFEDIIKLKSCSQVYKANNNLLPKTLQLRYKKTSEVHNYNTRNKDTFYIKSTHTTMKRMCPSVQGLKLYKELPENVKQATTFLGFKNKMKSNILKNYY